MGAIQFKSQQLQTLSIELAERFVKGKSNILFYLSQEDGLLLTEYALFIQTGLDHGDFVVSALLNGTKIFTLKINAELAELNSFNSSINFSSSMQCPIVLHLEGTTLTAAIYESKVPENTPKVINFFETCLGMHCNYIK